ncbi:YggS family pyridoxal phosphate-dependent enzyme [bacterium]|nr:YggS family pyridoxal phosphate-dependent enzyme [candidate division CSSED10-310 bacterium]
MGQIDQIEVNIKTIMESIPPGILLVAAAKTRTVAEVRKALTCGIAILGYNYIQEAEKIQKDLKEVDAQIVNQVEWHLIGHLQRNKAKKAVEMFDMIETIDSLKIAEAVNNRCAAIGKIMPVLIEINSGEESNKTGFPPQNAISLTREIAELPSIKVQGLMTMGPRFGDPEKARPYFRLTKMLFDELREHQTNHYEMKYLSMGTSNTYAQAIEEGANIVRIGTKLFGDRYEN